MYIKTFRDRVNKQLNEEIPCHGVDVPITKICEIVKSHGGMPIQEDGEEWNGFLCGEQGNTIIVVTHPDFRLKCYLNVSWYKLESGRWETVVYLS